MILISSSHFTSFNSQACPSFWEGDLVRNAALCEMKTGKPCTCSESFEQGGEYTVHQTLYFCQLSPKHSGWDHCIWFCLAGNLGRDFSNLTVSRTKTESQPSFMKSHVDFPNTPILKLLIKALGLSFIRFQAANKASFLTLFGIPLIQNSLKCSING